MLELKNITKKYKSTTALDDVSICFEKGKITSIYGPNGAGKSTLVKIICGDIKPDNGSIIYNNQKVNFHSYKHAMKNGISYVPQDFGLIKNLTVLENMALFINQIENKIIFSKKTIKAKIISLCSDLLMPNLKEEVFKLNAYEQQLLATNKALIFNSEIIIFDESTTNFNKQGFTKFKKTIERLKKKGKTILLINHNLDEVLEISDEVVILKSGKILKNVMKNKITKEKIYSFFNISIEGINKKKTPEQKNLFEITITKSKQLTYKLCVKKGEIVSVKSDNTSFKHAIGNEFFSKLNKKKNLKIGMIPALTDDAIFQNLSVRDNLTINIIRNKLIIDEQNLEETINNYARDIRLEFRSWNQNINELSGGNIQKVLLGRWILADFDVLILMEPTSGVDMETKKIIHKKILELKYEGKSFILITSDEGEQKLLQSREINFNETEE